MTNTHRQVRKGPSNTAGCSRACFHVQSVVLTEKSNKNPILFEIKKLITEIQICRFLLFTWNQSLVALLAAKASAVPVFAQGSLPFS